MLKFCALVPAALLTLSCGSDKNDPGNDSGSGGSTANGGGAGNPVLFAGSSNAGGTGTGGGGQIGEESADDLRKASCAGWSAEPEGIPAVLELVIDTSLSMSEMTRSTNGRTKWAITRDALIEAVDALPATTAVGVLFYPNRDTSASDTARDVSACVNVDALIPVDLLGATGSNQRDTIAAAIRRGRPNGSTPTHDAYRYALRNGLDAATEFQGNRFMLLITDGAPTLALECIGRGITQAPSPTQPIIDEVRRARARGVRSFLIGSPGSEVSVNGGDARPWMSEAAVMGDTASAGCSIFGPRYCHVDLTQEADFAAALRDALARIAGQVVSCSYDLPVPPPGQELDLAKVNVIYTSGSGEAQLVAKNDSATCVDGWRLDSDNRVILCENTCRQVQSDERAKLELLFGCNTTGVPVR